MCQKFEESFPQAAAAADAGAGRDPTAAPRPVTTGPDDTAPLPAERLNLELKVRDPDPAATERACAALGAAPGGLLRQRDTYFAAAHGKLKLREHLGTGRAELIAYFRPETAGVRASRYTRLDVPPAVRDALAATLGVSGVIAKARRLFLYEHVRIHLDEVAGLGSFVELEAVQPAAADPGDDPALERVIDGLGLRGREPIAAGYLELVSRP
jgi:adenylate cyclase class IV